MRWNISIGYTEKTRYTIKVIANNLFTSRSYTIRFGFIVTLMMYPPQVI